MTVTKQTRLERLYTTWAREWDKLRPKPRKKFPEEESKLDYQNDFLAFVRHKATIYCAPEGALSSDAHGNNTHEWGFREAVRAGYVRKGVNGFEMVPDSAPWQPPSSVECSSYQS